MTGTSVQNSRMDVGASAASKSFKEVMDELRLQITYRSHTNFGIHDRRGAAAEIHRGHGEGLVHRHNKISRTQNAAFAAQGLIEDLTQRNAHIFHGVVLINLKISVSAQFKIEATMTGKKLQHVIEEMNAGRDLILATPVHVQLDMDVSLRSFSVNLTCPHADTSFGDPISAMVSRTADTNWSICSAAPIVMRTQFSQPGS